MRSESGVDINLRGFFAETLAGQSLGLSLDVQRLGLSPYTVQSGSHAPLGFLPVDPLDAVDDHALALNLDALDDPL